jgi:hypothetical protein
VTEDLSAEGQVLALGRTGAAGDDGRASRHE